MLQTSMTKNYMDSCKYPWVWYAGLQAAVIDHILPTEVSPTSRFTRPGRPSLPYSQNSLQRLPLWSSSPSMPTVGSPKQSRNQGKERAQRYQVPHGDVFQAHNDPIELVLSWPNTIGRTRWIPTVTKLIGGRSATKPRTVWTQCSCSFNHTTGSVNITEAAVTMSWPYPRPKLLSPASLLQFPPPFSKFSK